MASTDVVAKLKLDTSDYLASLGTAVSTTKSKMGNLSSSQATAMKKVGDTATKAAKVATAAAVAGLTAFTKVAFDTYNEFESSMSQVAATLGYSVAEINDPASEAAKTMERLTETARLYGRTTKFTAGQASEALNYMALAGYDAEKSIAMLPVVLNLASAGNMELGRTSDVVTDAQTALGLSIEQTATLVDQMALASSKSNTSVAQLGDAILTIGGTAKVMSGGTSELTQVLGLLADNGIKGSEAGTKLRNILLRLANPTKAGSDLMKKLGIRVYDASGNMRDMSAIFTDLNKGLSTLTSQERTTALADLFNVRDIAAANALIDTSADRWAELGLAIDGAAGAAEKMAGTQLDNLQGDITILKSAWDDFKISFAERINENVGVREAVQSLTTFISEKGPEIATGLANIVSSVLRVALAVGRILADNPWIVQTAAFLTGAIVGVNGVIKTIRGVSTILKAVGGAIKVLIPVAKLAGTAITGALSLISTHPIILAIGAAVAAIIFLATNWESVTRFIGESMSALGALIVGVWNTIAGFVGSTVGKIAEVVGGAINAVTTAIANAVGFVVQLVSPVVAFFAGIIGTIVGLIVGAIQGIIGFVVNCIIVITAVILHIVTFIYTVIIKPIVGFVSWLVSTIIGAISWLVNGIISIVSTIVGWVSDNIITPMTNLIAGFFSWVNGVITGVIDFFVNSLKNGIDFAIALISNLWNWFATNIIKPIGDFFGWLGNIANNVVRGIASAFQWLGSAIGQVFSAIGKVVGDIFGAIGGIIKAPINGIIGGINAVIRLINGITVPDWVPIIGGAHANFSQIPYLATGGIVPATNGGRIVLAGEGGQDEWVVPESKMASLMSQINDRLADDRDSQTITINVSGVFATSAEERRKVADQIVAAINQNNQRRFA